MGEDLYVSCVGGHHVTRYGTQTLIGVRPDPSVEGNLAFDEAMVVRIPAGEYSTYRREYDDLIAQGALLKRTAEEYDEYQAERETAINAAAASSAPTDPPPALTDTDEVVVDAPAPPDTGAEQ